MTLVNLVDELDSIKKQLIENYQPEKIILYGSVARNEANEDSDIDLLLIKNTDKKFTERIRDAHCGLKYHVPLDIIVYTQSEIQNLLNADGFFFKEILEKGVVLYEQ